MSWNITLLLIYLNLAVSVSFLCSLCEASLLTLTRADAEFLARKRPRIGGKLKAMKQDIDRPLAAILTLNTISHTVGAAGVGAQATIVFGGWVGLTSAVLTLIILVFSEIVPKTIGAVHARRVAPFCTIVVHWMILLSYPIVWALELLGRLLKGRAGEQSPTREEILILAEMARIGGALEADEQSVIANMLRLREIRVEEVMTPRTVVFMLDARSTVQDALDQHPRLSFTRIPIMGDGPDDIRGVALRLDIYEAAAAGKRDLTIESLKRDVEAVPMTAKLMDVLKAFAETGHHLFLVVDEYGGTAGVITLEDVVETMLGKEIVDETDPAPDMRKLARRARKRRKQAKD